MKKTVTGFLVLLMLLGSIALAEDNAQDQNKLNVNPYFIIANSPTFYEESEAGLTAEASGTVSLALGGNGEWSVSAQGGEAPYSYQYYILTASGETYTYAHWSENSTFSFSILTAGSYTLLANVQDSAGNIISATLKIVVGGTGSDVDAADNMITVQQKVREVVDECYRHVDPSNEYEVALWLHDWLTHNAYYDQTYSNYDADGVLLRGTGVCDSYAKAYVMLLSAAGISAERITGDAAGGLDATWGSHAWALVQVEGVSTHIDPTWDDPITYNPAVDNTPVSGGENHNYFGLNDELIGYDHRWTDQTNCTSLAINYELRSGDLVQKLNEHNENLDFALQYSWSDNASAYFFYSFDNIEQALESANAFPFRFPLKPSFEYNGNRYFYLVSRNEETGGPKASSINENKMPLIASIFENRPWKYHGNSVYYTVKYDRSGRAFLFDFDPARMLSVTKPTVTYTYALEPVTVTATASGGAGSYTYTYTIYNEAHVKVGEQANVAEPSATFNNLPVGRYVAYVTATDGSSSMTSEASDVFALAEPLAMSTLKYEISPDHKSIFIDKPTISNGTGVYQIAYNIYDNMGNAVNYFYSSDARVAASPGANGIFNVFVVVSDGVSTVQKDVGWLELNGYPAPGPLTMSGLTFTISEDHRSIFIDRPQISGGTGNYTIAYNIYDANGLAINYFYSSEERVAASTFANGLFNVFVVVSDGATTVQKDIGWQVLDGYGASVSDVEQDEEVTEVLVIEEPIAEPTIELIEELII